MGSAINVSSTLHVMQNFVAAYEPSVLPHVTVEAWSITQQHQRNDAAITSVAAVLEGGLPRTCFFPNSNIQMFVVLLVAWNEGCSNRMMQALIDIVLHQRALPSATSKHVLVALPPFQVLPAACSNPPNSIRVCSTLYNSLPCRKAAAACTGGHCW